jgi:Rrf2 family protein
MAFIADHKELEPVSTGLVAKELGASENHLSKVFQRLTKAGLVKSVRGPGGGFYLASPPEDITLQQIYETIDGTLKRNSCLLNHPKCDRETCVFGGLVSDIQERVSSHFSSTTLANLVEKR